MGGYAEQLAQLRAWLAEFQEPTVVLQNEAGGCGDVQIARRRFALACLAAGVENDKITAALPGFYDDIDIPKLRPCWILPPFRIQPYALGDDADAFIDSEVKKFEAHLRSELAVAGSAYAEMKLKAPARHRERKLDLAARFFITVRLKILGHSAKDIALDHVNAEATSAEELEAAENLVRFTAHAIASEVRLWEDLR